MAAAFDDPRRPNAFLLLANIIGEGLLSAEELKQFSQEAQARIKMIRELREPDLITYEESQQEIFLQSRFRCFLVAP